MFAVKIIQYAVGVYFRYIYTHVNVYSDICMAYYSQAWTRLKLKLKPFMLKSYGDTTTTNSLVARVLVYGTRDNGSIPSW